MNNSQTYFDKLVNTEYPTVFNRKELTFSKHIISTNPSIIGEFRVDNEKEITYITAVTKNGKRFKYIVN
jgi:hypothetical protein